MPSPIGVGKLADPDLINGDSRRAEPGKTVPRVCYLYRVAPGIKKTNGSQKKQKSRIVHVPAGKALIAVAIRLNDLLFCGKIRS